MQQMQAIAQQKQQKEQMAAHIIEHSKVGRVPQPGQGGAQIAAGLLGSPQGGDEKEEGDEDESDNDQQ
jgi:hypothetical protein